MNMDPEKLSTLYIDGSDEQVHPSPSMTEIYRHLIRQNSRNYSMGKQNGEQMNLLPIILSGQQGITELICTKLLRETDQTNSSQFSRIFRPFHFDPMLQEHRLQLENALITKVSAQKNFRHCHC